MGEGVDSLFLLWGMHTKRSSINAKYESCPRHRVLCNLWRKVAFSRKMQQTLFIAHPVPILGIKHEYDTKYCRKCIERVFFFTRMSKFSIYMRFEKCPKQGTDSHNKPYIFLYPQPLCNESGQQQCHGFSERMLLFNLFNIIEISHCPDTFCIDVPLSNYKNTLLLICIHHLKSDLMIWTICTFRLINPHQWSKAK